MEWMHLNTWMAM